MGSTWAPHEALQQAVRANTDCKVSAPSTKNYSFWRALVADIARHVPQHASIQNSAQLLKVGAHDLTIFGCRAGAVSVSAA